MNKFPWLPFWCTKLSALLVFWLSLIEAATLKSIRHMRCEVRWERNWPPRCSLRGGVGGYTFSAWSCSLHKLKGNGFGSTPYIILLWCHEFMVNETVDGRNPTPLDMYNNPCKWWRVLHINWCRISSMGMTLIQAVEIQLKLVIEAASSVVVLRKGEAEELVKSAVKHLKFWHGT